MTGKNKYVLVFIAMVITAAMSLSALAAGGGCPSINALGNFLTSNKVGASFSAIGTIATYYLDTANEVPVNGVPGVISYCVYPAQPPGNPDSASALAAGADSSAWTTSFGAIQGFFAFQRPTGNPSNIPLDGTTGITVGTATWNGGAPAQQTILIHINDAGECDSLYGGDPGTCFVFPGNVNPPQLCNGNPACKQVVIDEALSTNPFTVPSMTLLHAKFTYIIVNQPTNTYNMIFNPPLPSTKDINTGGAKDHFGCEWKVDPAGAPGGFGIFTNYQGTGFTMNFVHSGGICDQNSFTMTAPSIIVLTPGQSVTFTVDMITRVNKGGKQEYSSNGQHFLNSGFNVKWIQSDDGRLHSFTTNPITVESVPPVTT